MRTPPIMQAALCSNVRDECSMCVRRPESDPNPNFQLWRLESRHPARRMVFVLCDECMGEVVAQVTP